MSTEKESSEDHRFIGIQRKPLGKIMRERTEDYTDCPQTGVIKKRHGGLLTAVLGAFLVLGLVPCRTSDARASSSITRFSDGLFATDEPLFSSEEGTYVTKGLEPQAFPQDPTADIPWSKDFSGVADIENHFNFARTEENAQLGTSVPMLTLPSQTQWDKMSGAHKALWLINRERIDRGIAPLHGLEPNVMEVARSYAQFLFDNDAFSHTADGKDPWKRLDEKPKIKACHDFLAIAENLAVFVTDGTSVPLPVERAVYLWMYDDSDSSWGHRHAILWFPYNDNSGPSGREGFVGIGRASGGPYQGPFQRPWNFAEIVVMNVFDPCPAWVYSIFPSSLYLLLFDR